MVYRSGASDPATWPAPTEVAAGGYEAPVYGAQCGDCLWPVPPNHMQCEYCHELRKVRYDIMTRELGREPSLWKDGGREFLCVLLVFAAILGVVVWFS